VRWTALESDRPRQWPSCRPVFRTRKGGKTTEVGDEIDRREIWRTIISSPERRMFKRCCRIIR
jgi:hypothetical protein